MDSFFLFVQITPTFVILFTLATIILIFMDTPTNKVALIKNLYLYLVSFVALMMVVLSVADIINIALRTYIFTKADKDYYSYPEPLCEPARVAPPPGATNTPDVKCFTAEEQKEHAEGSRAAQRERDLVRDISFMLVGAPLFAYHWRLARKKES